MNPSCPLCHKNLTGLYASIADINYYHCNNCGSVFKDNNHYPTSEEEKERYLKHENNVDDFGYKNFVSPITDYILETYPFTSSGLDFGAGTGPIISKELVGKGYNITLYDPFFHPDTAALTKTYDFIVCCEVIEHFHTPSKEFQLLRKLLKPQGKLICMTDLLPKKEDFDSWYYKNDPTHVIFYSEKNIKWIKRSFGFSEVMIDGRLIVFG